MTRMDLQQLMLEDFSPGIWDDWQGSGGATTAPHGAAQLTGTWGCVSGQGGGLIAGPKRVNRLLETLIDADGAGKYPTNDNRMHITAFRVASPVWDRTGSAALEVGYPKPAPDIVAVAYEYYYKGAANFKHKQRVRLYKMFQQSATFPAQGTVATYDLIANQSTAEFSTNFKHGYTGIDLSRSRSNGATLPGYPVIAAMVTDHKEVTTYARKIYPDDQNNAVDGSRDMTGLDQPGGFAGYALFAHQDRMVLLDRSINFGMGNNSEMPTDMLIASSPNDVTTNGVAIENFVAENPGLFGAWASVNASEAIFIKQQKGGFAIRGDIGYPTVVRLPSLYPTYDAINIPAVAPNGMVIYGSKDGVYGWAGAQKSLWLSKQLNAWFWKVPDGANGVDGVSQYLHTKGNFTPMQQYVAAPNNFLLDTSTNGWWRLTDQTQAGERPYTFYDTSAAGLLVAACPYVDANAATQVVCDYFDFKQGQTKFQWTSQPLKMTQNRTLDVREVTLISQGAGTVTITLTGIDGSTDNVVFTTTKTAQPEAQSFPISVRSHDAIVTILSDSGTAAAAPRVYRVGLGYNLRETARPAST